MKNNTAARAILVIGDVYLETQFFADSVPAANEFRIATDAVSVYGSKTINVSRILARLENTVSFFAHVGNDQDGYSAINTLQAWGILPVVTLIDKQKTGKIVVITNSFGKSAIALFPGANTSISAQIISSLENKLSQYDGVYAATNLPLDSLYLLTRLCKESHVPLFIDVPNQQSELDLSKISSANFIAPNRQEAELLTKQKIITIDDAKDACQTLRDTFKGTIIISLDKDGCVVFKSGDRHPEHVPTVPVHSQDETAAGDIFRAVFFDLFLKSNAIDGSLVQALAIATKSTLIKGVDNTLLTVNLKK